MKYKYIGTIEQLREFGFEQPKEKWRYRRPSKGIRVDNPLSVYIFVDDINGLISQAEIKGNTASSMSWYFEPLDTNEIQDLIDAGLVEVTSWHISLANG